ncbi:hypothetical protein DF027_21375 [Burkholderia cenocepacia]|uniref:LexA family protein n=1 Tax=Burkholderia cenocepacia TaxID=95486 RepID=UPI000F5865AC|nr:S24 family peptidase [Burkholderia cenocepacia]RQV39138.1 hypothetical protein DF027_21375 [Burkholderia cenocepacia]RQV41203.1 hypothetical protein DF028_14270 [Burkholderia cenocepacia]RQV78060.1 hypothetical protein DF010_14675 [Burkholderia cenocepacia]
MDKYEHRRLRLIEIRDDLCNGKAAELARKIGKTDSYVARMLWAEGKVGRKRMGGEIVSQVEDAIGIPRGSLDGTDPILHLLQNVKTVQITNTKGNIKGPNVEAVPQFGAAQRVPLISWASALETERLNAVVEEWINAPFQVAEESYYLRVRGLSMHNPAGEPSFRDGDLILVEPAQTADGGALVLVEIPGEPEPLFRQLYAEGRDRYLRALNPDWPEGITRLSNDARVIGVIRSKVVRY